MLLQSRGSQNFTYRVKSRFQEKQNPDLLPFFFFWRQFSSANWPRISWRKCSSVNKAYLPADGTGEAALNAGCKQWSWTYRALISSDIILKMWWAMQLWLIPSCYVKERTSMSDLVGSSCPSWHLFCKNFLCSPCKEGKDVKLSEAANMPLPSSLTLATLVRLKVVVW